MTKAELVAAIADGANLNKTQAAAALQSFAAALDRDADEWQRL